MRSTTPFSSSRRDVLRLGAAALVGCAGRAAGPVTTARAVAPRPPGMEIAFVRRGQPDALSARAPLTPETPIEVASLSKPVFAFAVLTDVARGALDLDAPLPTLAPPPYRHAQRRGSDLFDDPRLRNVTPRLLLSHRAGLPNWSRTAPLAFVDPPGERWRYSGEGYALLQRVLEASRHEPLDALARRAVWGPLEMASSTYDPGRVPARAAGHDRAGALVDSSLDAPCSATSLISTASDLAHFARRLLEAPPGDRVVSTMLTPEVAVDAGRKLAWGVGMALAEPEWFFHWGANPGYRALLVGSRARGEAVVILTDGEGGMEPAADVVRAHFGDLPLLGFPMLYPPD